MPPLARQLPRTPDSAPAPAPAARPEISSTRESVEWFVMFLLFFLLLGFQAEGFVIPTGSMAPTLLGRHKEITCPECGFVYEVDAHAEIAEPERFRQSPTPVEAGVCVNCRFKAPIADEPNFQGDRVYVMKAPLSITRFPSTGSLSLKRWDIAVFKLPEDPEIRYIKRVVGMPNETLRIDHGDIWVQPKTSSPSLSKPFRRALRPLSHQEAMQTVVYDDSHRAKSLASHPRWTSRTPDVWTELPEKPGEFQSGLHSSAWSQLRYRHLVPDPSHWESLAAGLPLLHPIQPTLITDFYSYNTDQAADSGLRPWATAKAWRQNHWVGDLTLLFQLDLKELKGSLRIDLVKAGVPHLCEFNLETGTVSLSRGNQKLLENIPSHLDTTGPHALSFANVDDRLTLRVDSHLPFVEGFSLPTPSALAPTKADLDPVGIAAKDASLAISKLLLKRDIYYTQKPAQSDYDNPEFGEPFPRNPTAMFNWLADPSRFPAIAHVPSTEYPIADAHYMMLGDNSPMSRDGRAWKRTDQRDPNDPNPDSGWDSSGRETWEVPESLLIGKAFCVHWPHLKPFGPTLRLSRDVRLPARPYFEKIRWVR